MGMLEMPYQRACRRYPSAGPLSGYPGDAPLWVSCCTLCAGIAFCSALRHFACRGHVLQRAAALCLQGSRSGALCCTLCAGGRFLSGNPGDAPRRVSWRCPSAGILETLGGAPQWVSWRCPISGHAGDTPRRYPGDAPQWVSCCTLRAGVTLPSVAQERPGSGHPGDAPSSPGVYGIRLGHEKQHKS